MTRAYDEFLGRLFDRVAPQTVLLALIALTGLVAALWYWYPAWLPRRLRLPRIRLPRPRLRGVRLRWRRPRFRGVRLRFRLPRRRRRPAPGQAAPRPAAAAAPMAAQPGMSPADRLAAQGRYAEAIRERLRETVADLTRAGVIAPQPGTTVLELTAAAAARRPALGSPLTGAAGIFSEIWYGRRAASAGHDDRMRTLTAEVRAALRPEPGERR
ncbi:DUF4129 domain-containing protein [Actinoplanes teichomyceticus]|uniref:Uncharacterized protein DUF4129 n=1 Tax=Actinoplanes teichomyceticus TaxID=1867 RepID=A0A561VM94_ACTTI|nr:DUF4129 domain-containing protein [Actinoplanes teichomyceticus]TWG12712.1 uncharacterized protein DUF4129 [Actinoplanes teichomyceticus]GIF13445.1 hypothetical protein Ate01nite_34770 [Actinoplanes teichomyceticus]